MSRVRVGNGSRAALWIALSIAGVLAASAPRSSLFSAALQTRPLPEVQSFYSETRANLERSQREQSRFGYKERRTEIRVNPFGKVGTSGETVAYEVTPEAGGALLRRLIERDGRPVADAKVERTERRRDTSTRNRERRSAWEDTVAMLQMKMERREHRDGRDVIVVSFHPRPDAEPQTREGRLARLFKGSIYVDEVSREVSRVEAVAIDTISIGMGFVARLYEGSTVTLTRQPVEGPIWLPTSIHFNGEGRALLIRKLTLNHSIEWFDYRRVLGPSE